MYHPERKKRGLYTHICQSICNWNLVILIRLFPVFLRNSKKCGAKRSFWIRFNWKLPLFLPWYELWHWFSSFIYALCMHSVQLILYLSLLVERFVSCSRATSNSHWLSLEGKLEEVVGNLNPGAYCRLDRWILFTHMLSLSLIYIYIYSGCRENSHDNQLDPDSAALIWVWFPCSPNRWIYILSHSILVSHLFTSVC